MGGLKPQPEIFAAALAAIRCPPEQCFYTDDIAEYVAAGRTYGLIAEVYTNAAALRQSLVHLGIELPD